ncbi:bifunctional 2-polyprenyl-6-hydroxyphenol methylase/3-demethylubiquinol 3-O-methyltransferase UbiG [Nocardia sp. XZ_19_369]|uniref:class I SAM-dependent methyltransferase n=1 Tax=Nocardia sp. XZ_19_369 TaxID=2769487 RepID=UPI0018907F67|nr:SAM-dependent methyltransferase [Nocardia sp. XZ_19_369]
MSTTSIWEQTLTFFPQFHRALAEQCRRGATVAVIGASDGKFVLPLAEAGYNVVAIEKDPLALYGGEVLLPVSGLGYTPGLVERVKDADLQHSVRIVAEDFLDCDPADLAAEAVWTSCSWHYSANHRRPLVEFITHMQRLVRPGGVFGAEFMMPVQEQHHRIEHYTTPDSLASYFGDAWDVLLTLQTDPFVERAHIGQLHDHTHRMGMLIASRHPDDHTKG